MTHLRRKTQTEKRQDRLEKKRLVVNIPHWLFKTVATRAINGNRTRSKQIEIDLTNYYTGDK